MAGVTIQGGWAAQGATWTAVCPPQSQGAVTISGSAQASATFVAKDVGGTAQMQTLTVLSKSSSSAAPGETVYGIMATGPTTKLVLMDVIVEAANGPEGTAGAMGASGRRGALGGRRCRGRMREQQRQPGSGGRRGHAGAGRVVRRDRIRLERRRGGRRGHERPRRQRRLRRPVRGHHLLLRALDLLDLRDAVLRCGG